MPDLTDPDECYHDWVPFGQLPDSVPVAACPRCGTWFHFPVVVKFQAGKVNFESFYAVYGSCP